jgi:hypothetical protein
MKMSEEHAVKAPQGKARLGDAEGRPGAHVKEKEVFRRQHGQAGLGVVRAVPQGRGAAAHHHLKSLEGGTGCGHDSADGAAEKAILHGWELKKPEA